MGWRSGFLRYGGKSAASGRNDESLVRLRKNEQRQVQRQRQVFAGWQTEEQRQRQEQGQRQEQEQRQEQVQRQKRNAGILRSAQNDGLLWR